ncbi:MAG: hypothetical protein EOP47_14930 [Sphingobacteriaceae bacterium]|nr:MAG: hypothetical protein EOP47_14930 [Sphingobacteriaceae bacterium]
MKPGIVKQLLIVFFIFSLLEKTGVSMLSLFVNNTPQITESLIADEEDTSAPAENKEVSVKEYWIFHPTWQLPEAGLQLAPLTYVDEESNHHLAYFPSVPTPPPNRTV